jgi:hypothetical protein
MRNLKVMIAAMALAAAAAAGSGAAMVSWGTPPVSHGQHASVADTWTGHARHALADTWTKHPASTQMVSWG